MKFGYVGKLFSSVVCVVRSLLLSVVLSPELFKFVVVD